MNGMAEPRWLSDEEQRAWRAVLRGSLLLLDRLDSELQGLKGITLADYEVLVHLSAAPDRRLRMGDLASQALLSKSRLSKRVDRLEQRGLVCREECADDRRGTFAVLSDAGMAVLVEAAPTHVAGVRRYLIDRIAEEDLPAVARTFAGVEAALDEDAPKAVLAE